MFCENTDHDQKEKNYNSENNVSRHCVNATFVKDDCDCQSQDRQNADNYTNSVHYSWKTLDKKHIHNRNDGDNHQGFLNSVYWIVVDLSVIWCYLVLDLFFLTLVFGEAELSVLIFFVCIVIILNFRSECAGLAGCLFAYQSIAATSGAASNAYSVFLGLDERIPWRWGLQNRQHCIRGVNIRMLYLWYLLGKLLLNSCLNRFNITSVPKYDGKNGESYGEAKANNGA